MRFEIQTGKESARSLWRGLSGRKGFCSRSADLFAGDIRRDL